MFKTEIVKVIQISELWMNYPSMCSLFFVKKILQGRKRTMMIEPIPVIEVNGYKTYNTKTGIIK